MTVSYDATLVILSILVAIIGSYTGLLLMARTGAFTSASYKLKIVAAAAAIGSSIWSMHFIAMLALGLPVPVEYDGLITTISVFVAIVLTGLGLYAASSGHITRYPLPVGGLLMGCGIAGMHYVGMSAIRASCIVSYAPLGVTASILIGMAVSTLALWFTLRERGAWETALGAVALGLAISSMHYVAMTATQFIAAGDVVILDRAGLTQHNLAFIVAITTFLICGLFLVLALPDQKRADSVIRPVGETALRLEPDAPRPVSPVAPPPPARIALRRNQSVFFAEAWAILAVRADGHYSRISLKAEGGEIEEYFCESSISALAKLLALPQFVRSHRSHIVNIEHVQGLRRQGDGGLLLLNARGDIAVPVSRANMRHVLRMLEGRPAAHEPPMPQAATA
jgi:NO-binding membrane sensor protein with MHYT domain